MLKDSFTLRTQVGPSHHILWLSCAMLVLFSAMPPMALSQAEIEEIVVTATKRGANLQEIPASVVVFGEDRIETTEIRNTRDLSYSVPGMVAAHLNGSNLITMRGLGTRSTSGNDDPAVAQHVDGVYQPRTQAVLLALSDLERVEVLKGPQGTLYGRNSTGGAINYVTRKPTEEFEGSISVLAGNFDRTHAKGHISGPIADGVMARASFYYNDRDGYVENLTDTFEDMRGDETVGGKLALRFEPSDNLTIDVSASHIETDTLIGHQRTESIADIGFFPPGTYTEEKNKLVADDTDPEGGIEQTAYSLDITWDVSDTVSIRSITGLMDSEYEQIRFESDYSNSPVFGNVGSYFSDADSFSQEINLNADLADGRLQLTTGLFYFDDEIDFDFAFNFSFFGFPAGGVTSLYNQENTAKAAFLDMTYNVTDDLRLLAGVRYSDEDKEVVQTNVQAGFTICDNLVSEDDWSATTPKFGLQFDVTDNMMVYATYQEGFKAGGFVTSTCRDNFDQEFVDAIEIGVKSSILDGQGVLNFSIFDYDYQDLQVSQLVNLETRVENAAGASIRGAELELMLNLTDNFSVDVLGSWLDTEFDEFLAVDPMQPLLGVQDLSGNQMMVAPEYSGTIGGQYVSSVGGGELLVRGEVYFSDEVLYSLFGYQSGIQDSYAIQNLYVSFTTANDNWTIRAFGKNLSDKEVVTGSLSVAFFGIRGGNFSIGRTYGLELTRRF